MAVGRPGDGRLFGCQLRAHACQVMTGQVADDHVVTGREVHGERRGRAGRDGAGPLEWRRLCLVDDAVLDGQLVKGESVGMSTNSCSTVPALVMSKDTLPAGTLAVSRPMVISVRPAVMRVAPQGSVALADVDAAEATGAAEAGRSRPGAIESTGRDAGRHGPCGHGHRLRDGTGAEAPGLWAMAAADNDRTSAPVRDIGIGRRTRDIGTGPPG